MSIHNAILAFVPKELLSVHDYFILIRLLFP